MDNCSKHKKDLFGETDMKKVAEAIGDLHYQALGELLWKLACKLKRDAFKDKIGGREKLHDFLWVAGDHIECAAFGIQDAWQISKPFMKE